MRSKRALPAALVVGTAGLLVIWACSERSEQPTESTAKAVNDITSTPAAASFVLLAKHGITADDRSLVTGGNVGVAASGTSTLNVLTVGFDARFAVGAELLAPRIVLKDRAMVGNVNATQVDAPAATTGTRSPFVAPPAVPTPATVSPGTAAFNVALGQAATLAPGKFAAVSVAARGTLTLAGGLYQFQSLKLDDDTRLVAQAASTVRIAGGLTATDRVQLTTASGQVATDLRIETSGVVGTSTNGFVFGNDAKLTATLLARRGVRFGDRLLATGSIAGEDIALGHDTNFGLDNGVPPGACTASTPNGTPCFDGNRCTLGDTCQNGVCVGGPPLTCSAQDDCHVAGVCAPATGLCSNPPSASGAGCDDHNACTSGDHCVSGTCKGTAVVCTASDSCHDVGSCDITTGTCSNPPKPTVACSGIDVPKVTSPAASTPGAGPREILGVDPVSGSFTIAGATEGAIPKKGTIQVPALVGADESALADFNHDQSPDLVFANSATRKIAWMKRVDRLAPLYDQAHLITIDSAMPSGTAGPMVTGDVDGDGDLDLVASFSGIEPDGGTVSTAYVYLNQNNGASFQRIELPLALGIGVQLAGKVLADFNGDGRNDLALFTADVTHANNAQVALYTNTGVASAPFTTASRLPLPLTEVLMTAGGTNWGALATADLDGDLRPDLVALGNRGGIFSFRSLGNGSFDTPEFRGIVPNLSTRFDIQIRDIIGAAGTPNPDGLPDIITGFRRTIPDPEPGPIHIFPGQPTGIPIRLPFSHPGFGNLPTSIAQLHFFPVEPPGSTTQVVGLVKGNAVVTTYTDDLDIEEPSIFVVAVNGHLLEWTQGTQVTVQFVPDTTTSPFPMLGPPLRTIECIEVPGWCNQVINGLSVLQMKQKRVETRTAIKTWIDHGTPPGTLVDSPPAVTFSGSSGLTRQIFVKGLDGRLWELNQVSGNAVTPGHETWINHGLPAPAAGGYRKPGVGVVSAVESAPSVILTSRRQSNGGYVAQVFVTDSGGQLARWEEETNGWTNLGSIGTNDRDTCFIQPGTTGGGAPKAITWVGNNGVEHVNVFVTTGMGDLTSFRDNAWEEPLGLYANRGTFPPFDGKVDDFTADFQRSIGSFFCPSQLSGTRVDRWPPLRGTPGAIVWRDNGDLRRAVYAVTGERHIAEYTWIGEPAPPPPLGPGNSYEQDSLARYFPRRDITRRTIKTVLGLDSDIVIAQGMSGDIHLVARDEDNQLEVFHPSADTTKRFDAFQDVVPETEIYRVSGTPGAIVGSSGTTLFSVRRSGYLTMGPDTLGNGFVATDLPPLGPPGEDGNPTPPPKARDNLDATRRPQGCKAGGIPGEQIFPQWIGAEVPRTISDEQFSSIYPDPLNLDQGYEAERLHSIQATVLRSHVSSLDNPFDHTIGPQSDRPQVHHDWNLNLALDIDSQPLLSDANIEDGGEMEIEWQQQDDMLPVPALPGPGDRVALRGRYIFDCGHPPFRTEIHAPDAMAVMHGSEGVLRFSPHGGPTWYQPADTNVRTPERFCKNVGNFPSNVGTLGVGDALWGLGICVRNLNSLGTFTNLGPQNFCYRPYEHSMVDRLNSDDDVPLEFDIPLPPEGSGEPRLNSPPGGPHLVERLAIQDTFVPTPTPHFHVIVPAAAMPTAPSTMNFAAEWVNPAPSPARTFSVEVKLVPNVRHDHMDTSWLVEAALWLFASVGTSCTSDDDDELVVYATINQKVVRIDTSTKTTGPVLVSVRPEETLTIGTHGFECDLSCGERWDDDFIASPNDRIGTTKLAFSANENFGAKPIGQTATYTNVISLPDLATPRSRELSAGDYSITVNISEVMASP